MTCSLKTKAKETYDSQLVGVAHYFVLSSSKYKFSILEMHQVYTEFN